uniref:Str_synth domain-containing protein n=1 Tax=Caenorhabditis tropicalis TaxID=1561998 RepID=A0A1I7U8U9_9PELO
MPIGVQGDDSEQNSSLFTIAVDPINRCFAKLMSPHKMLIFTESRQQWSEYLIPPDGSLESIFGTSGFPIEENRSLRETYGTHGHRVGAMQTRLTFHDLGGSVVARMIHSDKRNTTALVEFDHETQEIRVRKLATFNLDNSVSKMFYLIASPDLHVFLGVHNSAIVHIKVS